jgi:NAD(P)-dependent dehydrogenase (short-subunit alcohol dehydrogenase family)
MHASPTRLPRDTPASRALDALLETTVVGSFSRIGCLARRAAERWDDPPRTDGKVMVVTGASSGIGRAVALSLGQLGAHVWVLGRDRVRTDAVAEAIRSGGGQAHSALVDVADGASIEAFAERYCSQHDRLDALVHCAGALLGTHTVSADGSEMTVATHVLGPYRLTWHLAPLLQRAGTSAIVTVSSGGMYTERFDLGRLEMTPDHYNGVRAYARAKRAQVVLAHEWYRRWSSRGVASYAMHPGWVKTPGLASGLPFFRLGPLLRKPEEGADTAIWLAAGAGRPQAEEGFWHDRHLRREHYLPWTRPQGDPEAQGSALWNWCATRTGLGSGPLFRADA